MIIYKPLSQSLFTDFARAFFIHYFETFTFPPTVTMHATKRQELHVFKKCLAHTILTYIYILRLYCLEGFVLYAYLGLCVCCVILTFL